MSNTEQPQIQFYLKCYHVKNQRFFTYRFSQQADLLDFASLAEENQWLIVDSYIHFYQINLSFCLMDETHCTLTPLDINTALDGKVQLQQWQHHADPDH